MLLLAPPGAGKGTQGERLAARYGVRHIAAGDLLRAEARAETPLGRRFRDEAGRLNQRIAAKAGRVLLMVAGLPMTVK